MQCDANAAGGTESAERTDLECHTCQSQQKPRGRRSTSVTALPGWLVGWFRAVHAFHLFKGLDSDCAADSCSIVLGLYLLQQS